MDWRRRLTDLFFLFSLATSALTISLLAVNLCAASIAEEAGQAPASVLTLSEYITELDRLCSATRQLAQAKDVPNLVNEIPVAWHIRTEQQTFTVSAEWLLEDLNDWERKPSQETQDRMIARLQALRSEAVRFQGPATDVSHDRVLLEGILAGREFQNIHGPTWLDRLKQQLLELMIKLLGRVFRSSAIPTIGNVFVYGLMTLSLLAVAYWMYRTIRNNAGIEPIVPHSLPVSSKGWKLWMQEARLAAEAGNWRDAVHLGYWCGILFSKRSNCGGRTRRALLESICGCCPRPANMARRFVL
jgi:hypothetical protein